MRRVLQRMLLALAAAAASGAVEAAPVPETFPLGQSAASGAVCHAVRDYLDPLVQAGGKAWRVRCRGYSASLGRLYELPAARADAWQAALAGRAACQTPEPSAGGATRAACRASEADAPYVAFSATRRRTLVAAEGLAPLADILETGLKVAAGGKPPSLTAIQTSAAQAEIAADFPNMQGLAAAEAAAALDPQRLLARGYVQNNEWRFDEAEQAFRALVNTASEGTPAELRADALLNLAMNVSNNGRFDEADALFAEAEGLVQAGDLLLRARAQIYRALHERNRGNFKGAIAAAQAALRLRAAALGRPAAGPSGNPSATGGLVIDQGLAGRLNTPSAALSQLETPRVSPEDRLTVQDAQALQIIGASQAAMGDLAAARGSLGQSRDLLVRAGALGRLTAWLRARVEADIAALDLREGRADAAARGYASAISILRTRHAGSAAEGALLLELGRAQAAAGREDEALAAYQRAIAVFREQRGGLGGSADATAPYFDLLLRRIARGADADGALAAQFFEAAETVVPSATAETVNRLAARIAAGDDVVAGLARAHEDSRRRLRATESAIASVQTEGSAQAALRAELQAQLRVQQAEADAVEAQLFAANPRYNQLVAAGVGAAELRKALKPGEAYLKILPLAGRSYGVLVTPDAVKPYAVDLTRAGLELEVRRLRRALEPSETLPDFDVAASAALFDKLAGPVRTELLAARRLIYEPSGALVSLPVGVLVTELPDTRRGEVDYRRVAWLGTRMDTSLVTSGASFLQSRAFAPSRAGRPYLGFGDPALARPGVGARAYNLARTFVRRSASLEEVCGRTRQALLGIESLPETAQEVRAVGASLGAAENVVTGEAFNDQALRARSDLADYKVLYFATHGLLPQPDSCLPEPALVTSLGSGESDALLDTSEILELDLDADLVVLAACDTAGAGAGTDRTGLAGGGEALGGLTRAMIYAGSRAMMVSHWSVDSQSAVRLMTGVFASDEPTVAGALRHSQQALQADEATAHPYFWAPFTLVGDGARALSGRRTQASVPTEPELGF